MNIGSLYNPGFVGEHFSWWIGQIASDSTWRDNILPGKFESKDQIPGWGRRYKVRIIGLHDQGETEIPSDQLPWAQVMYPVTGGGGQANASATANLRQGMFVFGFFLDGQEQQVPVIMGVLGNNAQTQLSTTIGESRVTNTQPGSLATSGYATPADGNKDTNITVPDEGLVVTQPRGTLQQGAEVLRSQPGATRENVDAIHELSIADVKRNEYYNKKIPLLSVCDIPQSALKAIQTEIENLTRDVDKILNAANSYIDAASNTLGTVQDLIRNYSSHISKYMKIVFDKILEYTLKEVNKALSKTIDSLPPNQRHRFYDIKVITTQTIVCAFSKITNELTDQIIGFLEDQLETELPNDENLKTPTTPICSVESLTGNIIATNSNSILEQVDGILENINEFLNDVQSDLGLISNFTKGSTLIGEIGGSITSALNFDNLNLKVFGCDLNLNCPASDYYTIQNGSGAAEEPQQPRPAEVDKKASNPSQTITPISQLPYALPSLNAEDINYNVPFPNK